MHLVTHVYIDTPKAARESEEFQHADILCSLHVPMQQAWREVPFNKLVNRIS